MILLLGLWLGLVYGAIEASEVMLLSLVPGGLSWRSANSAPVVWVAPLVYGGAFFMLSGVFALLAHRFRSGWWDLALVFLLSSIGAFLALTLTGLVLTDAAAALLALGIASQLTRVYRRRLDSTLRVARGTLLPLLGVVAMLAVLVSGMAGWREAATLSALPANKAGKPNVLLLIIDTERADHLSSYGYARRTSPNLDRLAAEGALFERAYSSSSWTLPSHASMMTGRPLNEHHAGLMRRPFLDQRFPTLAEAMHSEGYATGGFVANTYWAGRQTGLDRGFLHYEDHYGNLGDALARTVLGRRLAYEVLPKLGMVDIPGRKRADRINRDLLGWIDGLDDRPFFAFVNYFDVHGPYLPPAPHAGTFSAPGQRKKGDKLDIGALTNDIVVPPEAELRALIAGYDESLRFVDAEIGRLLEGFEARGILDNTLVIVSSDHGESFGERGLMYHGHSLYPEQIHVPLLLRYPSAIRAGTRISTPVSNQQIPATVAEIADLREGSFLGSSLLNVTETGGETVLAEVGQRSLVTANWPTSRGWSASLITDRWQMIRGESGSVEVLDLDRGGQPAADPRAAQAAADSLLRADRTFHTSATGLDWRSLELFPWLPRALNPLRAPTPASTDVASTGR